ncbi:MAG: hypothetical protein WBY73_21400, partial [Candidatus Acidiferrales bacterium]
MANRMGRTGVAVVLATALVFPSALSLRAQVDRGITGFAPAHVQAEFDREQKMRAIPDAPHAESNLRHITSEPHLAGTEASHRMAEWLRDQYRSYGFDADIVSYSAWLPQAREVKLELTAPKAMVLGTPEQPYPV